MHTKSVEVPFVGTRSSQWRPPRWNSMASCIETISSLGMTAAQSQAGEAPVGSASAGAAVATARSAPDAPATAATPTPAGNTTAAAAPAADAAAAAPTAADADAAATPADDGYRSRTSAGGTSASSAGCHTKAAIARRIAASRPPQRRATALDRRAKASFRRRRAKTCRQ